jgi:hypothetical protein
MPNHDLKPTTRKDGSPTFAARGYSWPPFEQGNTASLVHGADSPRVIEAVARIVRDDVVEQAPWIVEPIFADALQRYCRAEARARLLSDHMFKLADDEGPHKVPIRLWESAVACDNAASKAAADLGLTPLARARLASLAATTEATHEGLARLSERGRAIRLRREAELAAARADDDAS